MNKPATPNTDSLTGRLRTFPMVYLNGAAWVMATHPEPLCLEAATEIERLRASLIVTQKEVEAADKQAQYLLDEQVKMVRQQMCRAEKAEQALRGEPVANLDDLRAKIRQVGDDCRMDAQFFKAAAVDYLLEHIIPLYAAPISGERERSPAQQMPATVTSGSGIAEVDSSILDRIESATSVKNTPVACSVVAGVSGERVREAGSEADREREDRNFDQWCPS